LKRKQFFFEKKNQKTFFNWASFDPGQGEAWMQDS